jgi:hypothetical protein
MPRPDPPVETRFQPGQSGNPAGRTNPAKRAAGEACWKALLADFEANGAEAVERLRAEHPKEYVTLVASGLPQETKTDLNVHKVESLHEEQARWMAESYIESRKRAAASEVGADPVHASVPAGLPTG